MPGTVLLAAVVVPIARCVGRMDGTQSPSPDASNTDARLNPDGSFSACRADRQSDGPASAPLRLIPARQEPESRRMLLMPLAYPAQSLATVNGTNGQMYSSAHFAWRMTNDAIVFTDIDNVQTYACRPVSDAAARVLSCADATNGAWGAAPRRSSP